MHRQPVNRASHIQISLAYSYTTLKRTCVLLIHRTEWLCELVWSYEKGRTGLSMNASFPRVLNQDWENRVFL